MTTTLRTAPATTRPSQLRTFSALSGLAALAVLLQGVWAGIFLQGDNRDRYASWIDVHARGGDVAIAFAALATAYAVGKLRERRDLWIGAGVLTVLLVLEAWLGGLVRDGSDALTIVHVPLAMALMGVAVWLPLRARRRC